MFVQIVIYIFLILKWKIWKPVFLIISILGGWAILIALIIYSNKHEKEVEEMLKDLKEKSKNDKTETR